LGNAVITTPSPPDLMSGNRDTFQRDAPIAATWRGRHIETIHRGTVAVCTPAGELVGGIGDAEQRTYLRSSAKPFQCLPLITTGAADRFALTSADIAIACSSHSGEPQHVAAVANLLARAELSPLLLKCGVHAPTDKEAAAQLEASGELPTVLHNNCSGKHTGMLVVCKAMGWPFESYMEPDHPLQRLIRENLAEFAGVRPESIEVAVDGCGVPAFYLSIRSIATAFARLASGNGISVELATAAGRIREAMTAHPFLVAGTFRFDTRLMEAAHGRVLAKGGAQGFQGIGLKRQRLGICLKVSDGSRHSIGMTVLEILRSFVDVEEVNWEHVSAFQRTEIRNHAGTLVGRMEPILTLVSQQ
jgi:L-asparaginase II